MKALVKARAEPGLWLAEVPEPEIGINDVLIKVLRTGICGTDLHIHAWDDWAHHTIPVPLVVGHEFVGRIVAVGANVSDFGPGDLVSGEGHLVCGRCRHCLAGQRHLCAHTRGVGVNHPGAFAEYLALPMTNIWRHADTVDRDIAAIFDPFGNAVHTALAFPVLGAEDVLITGAGPIGLLAMVWPSIGGPNRKPSARSGTRAASTALPPGRGGSMRTPGNRSWKDDGSLPKSCKTFALYGRPLPEDCHGTLRPSALGAT